MSDAPTVPCTHLDRILDVLPATGDGCPECVAIDSWWVHLRQCLVCGSVGCCDSSPNRHMTKHVTATEHPLVRSLEPGEDWMYCYVDEVGLVP
jgi:uncharacterized UBP type Zn finger protein